MIRSILWKCSRSYRRSVIRKAFVRWDVAPHLIALSANIVYLGVK